MDGNAVDARGRLVIAADALGHDLDAETALVQMAHELPRVDFDTAEHGMVIGGQNEHARFHRARTVFVNRRQYESSQRS